MLKGRSGVWNRWIVLATALCSATGDLAPSYLSSLPTSFLAPYLPSYLPPSFFPSSMSPSLPPFLSCSLSFTSSSNPYSTLIHSLARSLLSSFFHPFPPIFIFAFPSSMTHFNFLCQFSYSHLTFCTYVFFQFVQNQIVPRTSNPCCRLRCSSQKRTLRLVLTVGPFIQSKFHNLFVSLRLKYNPFCYDFYSSLLFFSLL